MKIFQGSAMAKGSMTALALAISLAACSDNKNENAAQDKVQKVAEVAGAATSAAKNSVTDVGFQKVLSYVPDDTAYLFTNKKIVPKEVMEFHLERSKQVLVMWMGFMEDMNTTSESKSLESKSSAESVEKKSETVVSKDKSDKSKDFFIALMKDLLSNMSLDKIANTGMKVDGHSALYDVDLAPVFRYEITNKAAVKETIKRAEAASDYSVEWQKCGEHDCIELSGKGDNAATAAAKDGGFIIVLLDDQITGGLYSADNKAAVMGHLTGKSKTEAGYAVSKWDTFLTDNKYQGYGDGYINLEKVYDSAEKLIMEQAKTQATERHAAGLGEAFDEKSFKACSTLAKRHIDHVPEMVFGVKSLEQRSMEYEIVLKTSPVVSTAIGAIPNSLEGMQQAANPVFDFGLNINFDKLRDGLTQYTNFLTKTAEEVHCDAVKADAVRKAMGGFTMATMMGANQFKAIYVAVNDLKMDATGKPEKVDVYASIFADQPGALLQMLGMVNPAFASIKLPEDGSPVKLPEGLVPPNPTGVNPEIYLSKKDNLLNVMVGDTKPELKPFKTDNPAFLWNTVDSKRYYQMLGGVMEGASGANGAGGANDEEAKKAMELMTKMGDFTGKIHSEMGADSRGITINYSVEYDK